MNAIRRKFCNMDGAKLVKDIAMIAPLTMQLHEFDSHWICVLAAFAVLAHGAVEPWSEGVLEIGRGDFIAWSGRV